MSGYSESAAYYDAIYRAMGKDYADEAAELRDLIHARKPDARTLLDIACGTGMHLESLAEWFEVTGADASPEMLMQARRRMPDIQLWQADMTTLDLGQTFDVVTCLFSSVAYMLTPARLHSALTSMARHLNPDGVLLIEPWFEPDEWRAGTVHAQFVDEAELKLARLTRSEVTGPISHADMHFLIATPARGVERFFEAHMLRLYTEAEYIAAFEAAGLTVEHLIDVTLSGRGLYVGRPAA